MNIKSGSIIKYSIGAQHWTWKVKSIDGVYFDGTIISSSNLHDVGTTSDGVYILPPYGHTLTLITHHHTKLGKVLYK